MPTSRSAALVILGLTLWAAADVAGQGRRDVARLASEGSAALNERRFGDAHEALSAALALRPQEASLHLGAGVAAFMMGRDGEAQRRFERALEIDPGYQTASLWLGHLHNRAGRLDEAIAVYERALERSPGTPALERPLADWRRSAALQSGLSVVHGAHFSVLFEGPADNALARRVVERLEAAYWRVGAALAAYPTEPVTVVLYSLEQYSDVTRLPQWTAAAYDGRIHLPMGAALQQTEDLDRVLGHEFVHAVVAMLGGRNVPAWLNEGLATALESEGAEEPGHDLSAASSWPRLSDLHYSFLKFDTDQAHAAYAVSTRAVRRMQELRGAGALVALLRDLSSGVPFASAFHQRMAMRYEDFQTTLTR
ncbi:MAG TPA: tetratricopeptide repeat protein [Vicinamibacterales bacterium]|nr:tetratricopeptide repeat protein [Vicinamibacterales bacterium]